jgi:formate/nitrite transporter FocA (FNT family)
MSNTELANFGLSMLSIFGFGIGTLFVGGVITNFDPDGPPLVSWIVGCIVFGIAMLVAYLVEYGR